MYQFLSNQITNQIGNLASNKCVGSLLKGVADMVLIFDKECQITYANELAGELLGMSSEELVEYNIYSLFPEKQFEFLQSLLQETMEKGQVYNRSTQFQLEGKKKIPVSISFSALSMDDELQGYMMMAKDNRHLMQATDALKQKNEQLERLFYRMSHDLQGPLASIQGMLELAEMDTSSTENIENYLKHIRTSTDQLKNTLFGLMQLQYKNEENIDKNEVSVRYLLESVISEFNNFPGRDEVLIHMTANAQITTTTDERILESVIQSVIENSIKFRKTNTSDSVIKVSVRNYKEGIKIKVKDNGLGMDKCMQQRAFDMFYRGHGHTKGSGLGLYIAKNAIEKLGGEVTLKSQPFLGTEVSIYLPSQQPKISVLD